MQFEFAEPFHARAITIGGRGGIPVGRVLAGEDGTAFKTLVTLPGTQLYRQGQVRTFAFPETAARFYRIEMTGSPLGPAATMSQAPSEPARQYVLTKAVVHSGARVHRWEEKAGFSFLFEYESVPTPEVPAETVIHRSGIVDLNSKMAPDGTLEWDVPAGRWTILRMGYSLTGVKNRPAAPAGLGYEADKLSRKRRGYDPTAYLPALTGDRSAAPDKKVLGADSPAMGGSTRYAFYDGDRQLLGRRRGRPEPAQLRRDHQTSDCTIKVSLSVLCQLCQVRGPRRPISG